MSEKILFVLLVCLVVVSAECPKECVCNQRSARCSKVTNEKLLLLQKLPKNITSLVLTGNHITSITLKEFYNFTKLERLILNHNQLSSLPKDVDYVPTLKHINLSQNKIKYLDTQELRSYNHITSLHLSGNVLEKIPALSHARSLENLILSNNKINKLSPNVFTGLRKLKYLKLDHNRLGFVYHGVFDELSSLQSLDLSYNKLEIIRKDLLSKLLSLEELYLQNNSITTLDDYCFRNLTLHRVDLEHNRIRRFKADAFKDIVITGKISLNQNPLHCGCWLIDNTIQKLIHNGDIQGICFSPLALKGRNLKHFTTSELGCNNTDSCASNRCQHNSVCAVYNATAYTCNCTRDYKGVFCEHLTTSDENNDVVIAVSVCAPIAFILCLAIGWYVYKKQTTYPGRCISKEKLICLACLFILIFLFALFVGLRIACEFMEFC